MTRAEAISYVEVLAVMAWQEFGGSDKDEAELTEALEALGVTVAERAALSNTSTAATSAAKDLG